MNEIKSERFIEYRDLKKELERISTGSYKEYNDRTFAKALLFIMEEIYLVK